jgi:hypothetical protein
MLFLITHGFQLTYGVILAVYDLKGRYAEGQIKPEKSEVLAKGFVIYIGFGLLMNVVSMFVVQAFILVKNMTTWELVSFRKISYISTLKSRFDAPFSRGLLRNLAYVFCNRCLFGSRFIKWEYTPSFCPQISRLQALN